jgi:hypothetical protein
LNMASIATTAEFPISDGGMRIYQREHPSLQTAVLIRDITSLRLKSVQFTSGLLVLFLLDNCCNICCRLL